MHRFVFLLYSNEVLCLKCTRFRNVCSLKLETFAMAFHCLKQKHGVRFSCDDKSTISFAACNHLNATFDPDWRKLTEQMYLI